MTTARILFLSANPLATSRLLLDEEIRTVLQRLRATGVGEQIELREEWAIRADDIPAALMRHRPHIVHFSAHGSSSGELLLVGSDPSTVATVPPDALHNIFKLLAKDIRCVVLSACYSAVQAEALVKFVPSVIGMSRDVPDSTAIAFAAGFYEALAFGESVQTAYGLGCSHAGFTQHVTDDSMVCLLVQDGIDAGQLYALNKQNGASNPQDLLSPPYKPLTTKPLTTKPSKITWPFRKRFRFVFAGALLSSAILTLSLAWVRHKRRGVVLCINIDSDSLACERGNKENCFSELKCQRWRCETTGEATACLKECWDLEKIGTKEDIINAYSCYKRICDNNNMDGCFLAARILEGKPFTGTGQQIFDLYSIACSMKHATACNNLGILFYNGTYVKQDRNKAADYFNKSCGLGWNSACSFINIKKTIESPKKTINWSSELDKIQQGCEQKNGSDCNNLGFVYQNGIGILPDKDNSLKYYKLSCELSFGVGCFNAAKLISSEKKNTEEVEILYKKACELKNQKGCRALDVFLNSDKVSRVHHVQHAIEKQNSAHGKERVIGTHSEEALGNARPNSKSSNLKEESPPVEYDECEKSGTGCIDPEPGRFAKPSHCLELPTSTKLRWHHEEAIKPSKNVDIVFLSSIHPDEIDLDIESEKRIIDPYCSLFAFNTPHGFSALETSIKDLNAKIIHFSGHGSTSGPIWIDHNNDQRTLSSQTWIQMTAKMVCHGVRCIVLNTCFSDELGFLLADQVESVIAVTGTISDRASVALTEGFYMALSQGQSILVAFQAARNLAALVQPHVKIRLFMKNAINSTTFFTDKKRTLRENISKSRVF